MKIDQIKKAVTAFTSAKLDIYTIDDAIVINMDEYEYDYQGACPDKAEKAEIAKIKAFGGLIEAMGHKVIYKKLGIIIFPGGNAALII